MKNIITAILLFMVIPAKSADYSFVKTGGGDKSVVGSILNEDGLAYNRMGYLFPGTYDGRILGAVVNYASVTFANVAFSTDSLTAGSPFIIKDAHGLQTGVAVKLEETAGTVPSPLIAETTYYAYRNSAGVVSLATTSAQAIANDPITIVSVTTTGSQTYTLVPVPYAGTPSFKWQASNDGSNWFDLSVTSITMSSPNNATSGWDFGWYPYAGIRLNVIAPTAGGIKMKAYMNIKQ